MKGNRGTRGFTFPAPVVLSTALVLAVTACDDENPFRTIEPLVLSGSSQVWQLDLAGFPSAWDFPTGTAVFIGTDAIGAFTGSWVLDERFDGTLIFRPFSTLVPDLSLTRTGIQDLGPVDYDGVEVVPDGGYNSPSDSTGVEVIEGHVYAFRISQISAGIVPINYGKLEVTEVGQEFPDDPASRYVRFRWAFQTQPLNRRVVGEEP